MPRLLLLQSDDQLSDSIAAYLGLNGYEVDIHKDPQAAVVAADMSLPDIIVTDLMLSGRSGAEFLYEVRSYPDWQKIPVIVTGNLPFDQIEPFIDAFNFLNVSLYLPRHFLSLSRLAQEIDRLVRPVAA